ncbi:MAG: multicopper oxidase domain-containing protein [Afipia sp.]|nr:multicopper oxidase domain-containing protein [Afipia sp.]
MTNQVFSLSRRGLLAGLGGAALASGLRQPAMARTATSLTIRARPGTLSAGPTGSLPIGTLETADPAPLRVARGDLAVTLSNELPAPIVLNWLGIDGAPIAEPLTGQPPIAPGGRASFTLPLRRSGTFLISGQILGDSAAPPVASRALIVEDTPPVAVERDEILLIEQWRAKPGDTAVMYTVNGRTNFKLQAKGNERLRLRIINGCARAPLGLKIENHDVRVMAIDSAPAEPFTARDGQLVLAPGTRIDALIDATRAPGTVSQIILHDGSKPQSIAQIVMTNDTPARATPLPPASAFSSETLPARLPLQGAQRVDLSLDPKTPWIAPASFAAATAPVFKVKPGRVVVMAVANPGGGPMVFRLHGHHVRLLDKLDDGWKPFWLDTLMLDKGQTQRIAFLAEYPGRWLMEATALTSSAPNLVSCYAVE